MTELAQSELVTGFFWPSGEQATHVAAFVCALNRPRQTPSELTCHVRAVVSAPPVRMRSPEGAKATDQT